MFDRLLNTTLVIAYWIWQVERKNHYQLQMAAKKIIQNVSTTSYLHIKKIFHYRNITFYIELILEWQLLKCNENL